MLGSTLTEGPPRIAWSLDHCTFSNFDEKLDPLSSVLTDCFWLRKWSCPFLIPGRNYVPVLTILAEEGAVAWRRCCLECQHRIFVCLWRDFQHERIWMEEGSGDFTPGFLALKCMDPILLLKRIFNWFVLEAHCTFHWVTCNPTSSSEFRISSLGNLETRTDHGWRKLGYFLSKPWCVNFRSWTWHRSQGYQVREYTGSISKSTAYKVIRLRFVKSNRWFANVLWNSYICCAWNLYSPPGYVLYKILWHLVARHHCVQVCLRASSQVS